MRYYRKKEILSELIFIKNMHMSLCESEETSIDILCSIQEKAILIGQEIERENTQISCETVRNLEEYCECIYKMSLKSIITPDDIRNADELIKDISQLVEKLITDKVRVAFFPYKASMWDSMESIWKAAQQDENCETEVIPVPFYERNDGENKAVECYEGDLFPDCVNITHYSEYNLKKDHPDISYIHNPYDQYNKVTMVHPYFFSDQIRKNSYKLVYVPYYIASVYSDENKIYEMSELPGFFNATNVVVQSEQYRNIMVSRGIEHGKLIVAGSPKFDAIQSDYEPEMQKKMKDKYSKGKIFLFNTSISEFLNNKKWFEIVYEIMNVFNKHKEDCLIWRPHPLMLATINTMRTSEKIRYTSIKNEMQKMENVYIDESANPIDVMKISDAMISDYSSLVPQYYVTGKPILCLNGKREYRNRYICVFDHYDSYFYKDGITVNDFVNMVESGKDPTLTARLKYIKDMGFDKNAGELVHRTMMKKLEEI